jgi:hypothetical protein
MFELIRKDENSQANLEQFLNALVKVETAARNLLSWLVEPSAESLPVPAKYSEAAAQSLAGATWLADLDTGGSAAMNMEDRRAIALAVERRYLELELARPEVIFCGSPLALAYVLGGLPLGIRGKWKGEVASIRPCFAGAEARGSAASVEDEGSCDSIITVISDAVKSARQRGARNSGESAACSSAAFALRRYFQKIDSLLEARGHLPDAGKLWGVTCWGQSCNARHHSFGQAKQNGEQLELASALYEKAGWFNFFEKIALIADRPLFIALDADGLLHNEHGPALLYPDGWGVYAYHGTWIPGHAIENPEQVSLDDILSQPGQDAQKWLIERFGQTRYWLARGAFIIKEDEFGALFALPGAGSLMLRVVNSTAEPDGTFKEYFLNVPPHTRTGREAVAWTFGLESHDYHPNAET